MRPQYLRDFGLVESLPVVEIVEVDGIGDAAVVDDAAGLEDLFTGLW